MSITLTPSVGSAVTLCHGPGRTLGQAMGPAGLAWRCTPGTRERRYVEDTGPRNEATGMDIASGSFSVVIRCASKAAADTAASAIIKDTPRVGTLTDGTVTLYDCAITDLSATVRGRAVYASYAFSGALAAYSGS